ncbi:hypothetical protein Btru_008917 [Bulinus truncatus]|nr:hypothetical protein Btru_008917 [Bulinus truncatus]
MQRFPDILGFRAKRLSQEAVRWVGFELLLKESLWTEMKDIQSILVMSRQNSDLFEKDDHIIGFDSDIQHELAAGMFRHMGIRPGVSMMDYTERLIELSSLGDDLRTPQTPPVDQMSLITLNLAVTSAAEVIAELVSTVDSRAGTGQEGTSETYTSRLNVFDACDLDLPPSSQTFFDTSGEDVLQSRHSSGGSFAFGNHTDSGSHLCHAPDTTEPVSLYRLVHGDSELNQSQTAQCQSLPETFDSHEVSDTFSADLDFHPQIHSSDSDLNQILPSVSDLIQMYPSDLVRPSVTDLAQIHPSVGDLNQTYTSVRHLSQIHPSVSGLSQTHLPVSDVNPIHPLVSLTMLLEDDNMPKEINRLSVSECSTPVSKLVCSSNSRHQKGVTCHSCSLRRPKKEMRSSSFYPPPANIPTQKTHSRPNAQDISSDNKSNVNNLLCLPEAIRVSQFRSVETTVPKSNASSAISSGSQTTLAVTSSHKIPPLVPQDTIVSDICQTPDFKSLPNWEPVLLSLTDMDIQHEIEVVENKATDFLDLNTPTEIPRDCLGHHMETLKPQNLYNRRFSGQSSSSKDSSKPFSKPVLSELSSDALLSPGDVDKTFLGCPISKSQSVPPYKNPEFSSSDVSSSMSSSLPDGDAQEVSAAGVSLKNKLRSRLKAKGATMGSQTDIVSTDTSGSSSTQDFQSYIASTSSSVNLYTTKRKLGDDSHVASRAKKTYVSPLLNVSEAGSSEEEEEEEEDLTSLYFSSSETEDRGKKRSSGRKKDDEEEEDEMTILAKRQKNRIAAQKCRHKKRDKIESLTMLVQRLESRQDRIKSEVDKLNDEREQLEEMLRVHSFVCPRGHHSDTTKH